MCGFGVVRVYMNGVKLFFVYICLYLDFFYVVIFYCLVIVVVSCLFFFFC